MAKPNGSGAFIAIDAAFSPAAPAMAQTRGLSQKFSHSFAQACREHVSRLASEPKAPVAHGRLMSHLRSLDEDARGRTDLPAPASARIVRIDEHWRIVAVTPDAADWIGAPEEDLLGRDARRRLALPQALVDAVTSAMSSGRPARVEFAALQHPGRWVEFHVEPTGPGVRVSFWEVTERKLAELRERRDGAPPEGDAPLPNLGDTEIALLDRHGVVVSVNDTWRAALLMISEPAGVGAPYLEVCRRVFAGFDETPLRLGLKDLASERSQAFSQACRMKTPDGLRWRQVTITPMRIGPELHLLTIHTDLTEAARAQAALRDSEERVLRAQQDERQRIAIELHDSTSQHLIALGLGIARLRRLVGGPGAQDVLEDMSTCVQEAVKEVRVLSYLMKPTGLDRDGLEATARGFVTGFGARTGLHVSFRAEGAIDEASAPVRLAVFRVVQEALANVYRHAKASGVEVELTRREGMLSLRVADDGRGIPALRSGELPPSKLGVGVAAMSERVAQLRGRFAIASDKAGTVVTAQVPVAA